MKRLQRIDLFANAEMWRERRAAKGRLGVDPKPSKACVVSARKYYAIRNHIYIMRKHRRWDLAIKQAGIQCIAKPLYTCVREPRTAIAGAAQAIRASRDGFFGRMGKRIEFPTQEPDAIEVGATGDVSERYEAIGERTE